jgi:hypothetical protein
MVTKAFLYLLFSLAPFFVQAQLLEFHAPEKLPASINSAGEEALPLLSPNGSELYFTRALYAGNTGGKFSGVDVWFTENLSGTWKNPSNNFININDVGQNAIVGLSRDGATRYFVNASSKEKLNGIYVTKKINNYWTRPEFIPVPGIDNQTFLGVFVDPDFEVILFSMKTTASRGEEDLYFSVKNSFGQWAAPKSMGTTINTTGFEISPFLSDDKKRLFFSSNGHGGEGDADIFYSDRLYNSWETWSVPVNLGKVVNSKKFDAYFSVYGDSIAYFASNRDGKFSDIYKVKVAPAKTVLASGQRYLTQEEWNRQIGANVSDEISFKLQTGVLDASQKEYLFYIANKLQLQKDILFHLVVKEEENQKFTESRLTAITDHLVQSGIERERILIEQVEPISRAEKGKVEIRLIKR